MFITNFDDALAANVVGAIKNRVKQRRMPNLYIPCPDKEASRIEWDKFYLRELINEINPKYNPINFMAVTDFEIKNAIDYFEKQNIEIVIKPRNLTGGKGVKVMGKHFDSFLEGQQYAQQVLLDLSQTGVEIQEKLDGHEFTLQIFTDGKTLIRPPATFDYPYREDGDKGPGTGGMGSFSMNFGENLPFITNDDYDEAFNLMDSLILNLKERGIDYKGILYPTFFKTTNGLKIVEINARGGDPELINILDLMEDDIDIGNVLKQIATGELINNSVRFKQLASAVIYLVSPGYGYKDTLDNDITFDLDHYSIISNDCRIRFAATKRVAGNKYKTVKTSRILALSANGQKPWDARKKIHNAISESFSGRISLDYRDDVAKKSYMLNLGK